MTTLEFWPDYGGALLWTDGGERTSLEAFPIAPDLVERARTWIAGYDDSKLPWEPTRDDAWLAEGRQLFADLRMALLDLGMALEPNEEFWASSG
jgi:hypothetical protein